MKFEQLLSATITEYFEVTNVGVCMQLLFRAFHAGQIQKIISVLSDRGVKRVCV